MLDSEVVAAIVAGDSHGLAEAYDRYAAALYAYCRTMLREPADAADIVQDTFVIAASRLSGLRNPERLRSWLYAVARNECHRRLSAGDGQAPLEEALDVSDTGADLSAGPEREELRALVRQAMSGLGPAEREVLQLQLSQGLDSGEVASVLAVPRNHAHALLSRARDQLETALGVLIVARAGRRGCPALDRLLTDWDGQLTILLRKRVSRHIERCPACSERRRQGMAPTMFLGALPIVAAVLPAGLRNHVLRAAAGASRPPRTTYPFGHHGFPKPLHPPRAPWWHPRPLHVGIAGGTAAAGTAITLAIVVVTPPGHIPPLAGRITTSASPVASTAPTARPRLSSTVHPSRAVTRSDPVASPTPTRARRPSPSPSVSTTAPTGTPTATPTTPTSSAPTTGTLKVSPTTLDASPSAPGTITLSASGGAVSWTVREPPGLEKKVVVSPMSGTLAAGARSTVTVTVTGQGKPHVHLVFSPGGTTVTVIVS
ncbi:MAG TPA: sigma-70 family RNA polymerase sigma factor [Streptosporangiaceae bacterium]|jgi:RNA polymerase sigma factor (sigma-70 family)|nr:sigma-70 family RNA polymerase sigma factor [Streptosporangiaceae bacterium]